MSMKIPMGTENGTVRKRALPAWAYVTAGAWLCRPTKRLLRTAVGDDNIIFVIKPAGYALPLDKDNMPVYYYIHKPFGTPDAGWRFKGVKPTGKLPDSIDFALRPSAESDEFKALIFGDPQVRTEIMLDFFDKKVVDDVRNGSEFAFGIGMGDVSDEDLNLMGRYREMTGKIGAPWYNVVGNHDSNYDAKSDSLSTETFVAHFGRRTIRSTMRMPMCWCWTTCFIPIPGTRGAKKRRGRVSGRTNATLSKTT